MTDIQENNFGEKVFNFISVHQYSTRGYAKVVDLNHSTFVNLMKKDTATLSTVLKMVQRDNRILKLVKDYFNEVLEEQNKIKFIELQEAAATYQTIAPPEGEKIIELQKEIIKLNELIIHYQNIIKNENDNNINNSND
jgi:hypothetical protein